MHSLRSARSVLQALTVLTHLLALQSGAPLPVRDRLLRRPAESVTIAKKAQLGSINAIQVPMPTLLELYQLISARYVLKGATVGQDRSILLLALMGTTVLRELSWPSERVEEAINATQLIITSRWLVLRTPSVRSAAPPPSPAPLVKSVRSRARTTSHVASAREEYRPAQEGIPALTVKQGAIATPS